jgi:glutamine amidotransferase-like uncharacterized protein
LLKRRTPQKRAWRVSIRRGTICLSAAICVLFAAYVAWRWARVRHVEATERDDLVRWFAHSIENTSARRLQVGLFKDEGDDEAVASLTRVLAKDSSCTLRPIAASEIRSGCLNSLDVIIFPGGRGKRQSEALGAKGRQAVRSYVQSGGGCVGVCAGAYLVAGQFDWSLRLIEGQILTGEADVPEIGHRSMWDRGAGSVQIEFTAAGKLALGSPMGVNDVRYSGGPIFCEAGVLQVPKYVVLARYRTEIADYDFQRGTMVGSPAIIAARFGDGRVIAMGPHPEMTPSLEYIVRQAVVATARDRRYVVSTGKAMDKVGGHDSTSRRDGSNYVQGIRSTVYSRDTLLRLIVDRML